MCASRMLLLLLCVGLPVLFAPGCGSTRNCCGPSVICCSDHTHCCPHGTTCNLAAGTCDSSSGSGSVPLLRKVPTFGYKPLRPPREEEVMCDATHHCPAQQTCCRDTRGRWSCCPLPQAVCCADGQHCCPFSSACDLSTHTCKHQSLSTLIWRKEPAAMVMATRSREPMEVEEKVEEKGEEETGAELVVPCDDHTSCPDHHTCCFNKRSEKWLCCPLQEAVCCAEGRHCCPSGSHCGEHHRCTAGGFTLPWYTSVAASSNQRKLRSTPLVTPTSVPQPTQLSDVPCDHTTSCKDGQTCCSVSATTWGCCPLPHAVCCSDRKRCCPSGFTCSEGGQCVMKPRPS